MDWVFSSKAKTSIRKSTARINIWHGSVRSGKTISSLIRWVTYVGLEAPPGDLLMVGKTERTLKRNVLGPLHDMVGSSHFALNQGEGELRLFGRRVYLVGANDARAEQKIRGMTVAGFYGDELTLWPESFYRQLLARMSVRGAKGFGSTNPDGPYHYLKTDFIDRAGELDLRAFHFVLADNPALDPTYITALEAEYGPGSIWHRRFILGQWVLAEGAVYDMFNESKHVIPKAPAAPPDHLDVAIDYGTSNPFSAGLYATWSTPQAGLRALRLRGYHYDARAAGRQRTDAEYVEDIIAWLGKDLPRVRYFIIDPSAASFKTELRRTLRNKSVTATVRNARNEVINGIRLQARMLTSGEYRILRDSSNAPCIQEYGAYVWDPAAQARGEDKPLKEHDHTKDEERYFLATIHGREDEHHESVAETLAGY